jgi:hypothetical protein
MLFQQQSLSAGRLGFVLDLDSPLEGLTSLTAHHDPRAVRYAAYNLISSPFMPSPSTDAVHPRHGLESLFHTLVWFCLCNRFGPHSGITPMPHTIYVGQWFDPTALAVPEDRTAEAYRTFVRKRRLFLLNWQSAFDKDRRSASDKVKSTGKSKSGDLMCNIVEDWVGPLWKLVGEAHIFSRWKEKEEEYDYETLGGHFTVEKFMAILEGKS